uniref:glycosyltransferase family 4 protein n=1 Tax=Sphingomonas populi TaxID=2484750 RepID=UPI0013EE561E|nr:glycosyltransferase family 4 protein [Sphingomonas populi]
MKKGRRDRNVRKRATVYTSSYRGGASWFVLELAAGMAAAGGDVLLISPRADPEEREALVTGIRRIELPRGAYGEGSKLVRLSRTLMRILSTFVAYARARGHGRSYVISFYDWLIVLVLQMLWIRLLGGHIVYVVHDARPHAWASPGARRRLESWLLKASYYLPQQLVTLTEVAREQVINEFGRRGPISVIPHGAYSSSEIPSASGKRNLLAFGMLRRNKRILETIEGMRVAVADGARATLTIAGGPHKEDVDYWTECETRLLGTEGYIHTEIEFIPEARLDQLLAKCDALILPYEEFSSQSGVAVLAACSGRLLVCTEAGGLGELIANGLEAVVIERPVTAETVADAIRRFDALPIEQVQAKAERSKAALDHYFSWVRIGGEYLKLCRRA